MNATVDTNGGHLNRFTNDNTGTSAYTEVIIESGTSGRELRLGASHNFSSAQWNNAWVYAVARDLKLATDSGYDIDFYAGGTDTSDIKMTIGSSETTTLQDFVPNADDTSNLGSTSKRWADVFAVQTTTGGVFETGLKTEKIGDNPTGTIVSWRGDGLVPCDSNEDELVMGVIKEGKDEPIVMGAEPVLVTGKVEVGDYIVTSDKIGHGKSVKRGYLLKKDLFGKVIAQALESCDGDSNLIKCMIRKM